ncbi:FAD binding domain-containing protein [Daldinia vernicosa]|uniref:FAD binding domain-containing protein n=1 Tax=Daldinia vernicosa TaxID=114800 RepID=UPI002008B93A|nr:FAD binding domain-containing protein [Daldinia vernicosa]KAI0853139.1 FAD binding domain-containing protein [Daldinia vernicosa]
MRIITATIARCQQCRCIPGDPCWPSLSDWAAFNETVEGRLITTIPLASLCHEPFYDEVKCTTLKQDWPYAQTHIPSSSSVLAPLAQNQSCDPFTPPESACRLGNYPAYAVNASNADHVAATLRFAREQNIRLIIKSTGHDLLGKSSGAGSLSIWMRSFQNLTITENYYGSNTYNEYHGPAIQIEPGVLTYQALEAAQKAGLRVVSGTCTTVAIGAGYVQGGGHSILSSKYGLAADNVLEWDVMTADGQRITATPFLNSDLYWALSGGGPGVFAVVLSVTVKAFPDGTVVGAGVTFNLTSAPSEDAFWSAVESLHASMPAWLEQNATASYVIAGGILTLQPLTLPDGSVDKARDLIQPLLSNLTSLKIPYTYNITSFPTFLDLYTTYYGPLPYGPYGASEVQVSRLLPYSIITDSHKTKTLVDTHRNITALDSSFWIVGTALSLPQIPSAAPSNAVLPAWRDAAIHQMIVSIWDWEVQWQTNLQKQNILVNTVLPTLRDLSPGSGTYMNEGNSDQVDWKEAFYGVNYKRLEDIKEKWDPTDVFYAHTGVGSSDWGLDHEGRLCTKGRDA